MRCFAYGDMDIVFESVKLTVKDDPLPPPGALVYEIASDRRSVRLDGSKIESQEAFMDAVATALGFPDHFVANWDALDECLRAIDEPTEVEWVDSRRYHLADPEGFK